MVEVAGDIPASNKLGIYHKLLQLCYKTTLERIRSMSISRAARL